MEVDNLSLIIVSCVYVRVVHHFDDGGAPFWSTCEFKNECKVALEFAEIVNTTCSLQPEENNYLETISGTGNFRNC